MSSGAFCGHWPTYTPATSWTRGSRSDRRRAPDRGWLGTGTLFAATEQPPVAQFVHQGEPAAVTDNCRSNDDEWFHVDLLNVHGISIHHACDTIRHKGSSCPTASCNRSG